MPDILPDYRVVLDELRPLLHDMPGKLIGIDGRNGVGKTTLGRYLAWQFNISLIETDAQNRSLLNSTNVKAFICKSGTSVSDCNNALAGVQYFFAVPGEPTMGGASFTTDGSGLGPGNTQNWSGTNYLNGMEEYWTNRCCSDSTKWANSRSSGANADKSCDHWGATSTTGIIGTSNATDDSRWDNGKVDCSVARGLVCFVHP